MQYAYDDLIFIGRFQPPHNVHLAVLQHALTQARRVVIVLGSANKPRSPRNPFNDAEHREIILAAMDDTDTKEIINHFLTDRGASHRHVDTISNMSGSTA